MQHPQNALWASTLLSNNLSRFTDPSLTDKVVVDCKVAILFFGQQYSNEGLTFLDAQCIVNAPLPQLTFLGDEIQLGYEVIPVQMGVLHPQTKQDSLKSLEKRMRPRTPSPEL